MRLRVLTVGKPGRGGLAAAGEDYLKRLGRYVRVEASTVREERAGKGIREADVRKREGDRLLGKIPAEARVVALDREGQQVTSEALARRLDRMAMEGREVVFVVGGAFGLDAGIRDRAEWAWSLSDLTLPHELARVTLLEQLYRAHTILRGEPYHK